MSATAKRFDWREMSALPPAVIDRVIAEVATLTPWKLPLLRAARSGDVAYFELDRGAKLLPEEMAPIGKPAVVVIGDDDDMATGPAGWPGTRRLLRYWASGALIHAAGGEASHYEVAIGWAQQLRRVVIVETSSTYAEDWMATLPAQTAKLLIWPTGGAHPIQRDRESMQ